MKEPPIWLNNLLVMSQRRQAGKAHLAAEPVLEDGLSSLAERVGAAGVEAGEHVLPHRVAVDAVHGGTIQTVDAIHGGDAGAARAVGIGRWQGEQGMPLHRRTDEERSGAKCC